MSHELDGPMLLAVTELDQWLELRIDQNASGSGVSESSVRVLALLKPDVSPEDREALLAGVGKHISENYVDQDAPSLLELYIDYAIDYVQVVCAASTVKYEAYNEADLRLKVRALASSVNAYVDRVDELEGTLNRLRLDLTRVLDREIEVADRKITHFRVTRPEQSNTLERQLGLLQRLRGLLEHADP